MAKAVARKFDTAKALELRLKKGLSYADIGKYFGCSRQAIEQGLSKYTKLLHDNLDIEAYEVSKADILSNVELTLLNDLVDTEKREKATLGNVAYAIDKINNINRLQRGQATSNVQYLDLTASLDDIRRQKAQLMEQIGAGDDIPEAEVMSGEDSAGA
jgi:transcriptional regulator with XRE-family HTH domain